MLKTAKGQRIEIFEQIMGAPTGRVDRAGGFIRGVKILGRFSRNKGGYEYTPEALRRAAELYEGMKVNVNHPSRSTPNASRGIEDGIGWLENVTVKADGVYGDLAVLKSHPMAEMLFEAAERNPRRFGLSHNASGRTIDRGGKRYVESFDEIRSVDLVQNPATNESLFESEEPAMNKSLLKSKARMIAATPSTDKNKLQMVMRLIEEITGSPVPPPSETADPCESLKKEIRGLLTKPGVNDSDKLMAISEIVGSANQDREYELEEGMREPPARGAKQMAESYRPSGRLHRPGRAVDILESREPRKPTRQEVREASISRMRSRYR